MTPVTLAGQAYVECVAVVSWMTSPVVSWVTSLSAEQLIAALGSAASVIVLLILTYTEWIKPFRRMIKLKRPVRAHFTGREPDQKHPHLIRQLVLPSHQLVDVEVGFRPRTRFHAIEIVFGCEG